MKKFFRPILTTGFWSTLITGILFCTPSMASEKLYQIDISSVGHLRGHATEVGLTTSFTNQSGQDVSLIFDPDQGARVQLPENAEPFVLAVTAGAQASQTFSVAGFYRFSLKFADGSEKSGELAVVEAQSVAVDIVGITFSPKVLRVKAGQTVRWINTTGMVHTVTADPSLAQDPTHAGVPEGVDFFDSGNIGPGETFLMRFDVPGEYLYFCKPHEMMGHVGTIIVE